jgi:UDP-N-acetylglucosamine 2-epimerase (non-hydrolysing)
VNATLACSVTAKKLHIKVCHIEAGLRSHDLAMPEEINRLVTDRLSDLLLIPDRLSGQNLKAEGVPDEKIVMVGNIMIDTLDANLDKANSLKIDQILENNRHSEQKKVVTLEDDNYALLTMHRPSNVDDKLILSQIVNFIVDDIATVMPVVWTVHPRTEKLLKEFLLWDEIVNCKSIQLLYPLGYHDMLRLNKGAKIMLTDSGGLQEECTVLGTRCLTMRWNTERPVTLKENGGASVLVGNNVKRLKEEFEKMLNEKAFSTRPEMWDGKTAQRCISAINNYK